MIMKTVVFLYVLRNANNILINHYLLDKLYAKSQLPKQQVSDKVNLKLSLSFSK